MENIHLYYNHDSTPDETEAFFQMQEVIRNDFKRFTYFIEDCNSNQEKEQLLSCIHSVIDNICYNRFENDLLIPLEIKLLDHFLIFSYHEIDSTGEIEFDQTPIIVILSRDLHEFYFIDATVDLFEEDEEQSLNKSLVEIDHFTLHNHRISKQSQYFKDFTTTLFYNIFQTDQFYFPANSIKDQFVDINGDPIEEFMILRVPFYNDIDFSRQTNIDPRQYCFIKVDNTYHLVSVFDLQNQNIIRQYEHTNQKGRILRKFINVEDTDHYEIARDYDGNIIYYEYNKKKLKTDVKKYLKKINE